MKRKIEIKDVNFCWSNKRGGKTFYYIVLSDFSEMRVSEQDYKKVLKSFGKGKENKPNKNPTKY
jgi:hypothetical protein